MKFTNDELHDLSILEDLPEWALSRLYEHGIRLELDIGDRLFTPDHPADYMFIVVGGTIQRHEEIAGQWLAVATTKMAQSLLKHWDIGVSRTSLSRQFFSIILTLSKTIHILKL